jgi:hypothetical protein
MKGIVAIGISVWMGLLACLAGCLPALAHTGAKAEIRTGECAVPKLSHDPMADMECCHRSGNNPSTPEKKRSQSPENACCPLNATVIQKQDAPKLAIFALVGVLFYSVPALDRSSVRFEDTQTVWRSGRDTLLEIHLLRI